LPGWKKWGSSNMGVNELKKKIESLEIKLQHIMNDYFLIKEKNEETTQNYLKILLELKEKNRKLQELQKNLEKIVKERTEELRRSQEFLTIKGEEQQIMLDSSPAMIFYEDLHGRYVRVNKSFSDVIGMPPDIIIGKTEADIFPGEEKRFERDNLEILKTGNPKHNMQAHIKTPAGMRWILLDKIPHRDIDGNIIGIIGFALDITDRKRLEKQLIQSEKLATVGQLVAGVAHELNNPLSIISGFSQLLRNLPYLKPADRNRLDKIIIAAERCTSIVDNLLKFSRKSKMEKSNVQVNTIIADTVAMAKNALSVENITVKQRFADLPLTVGDPNQLQSVFLNLINNARDAILSEKNRGTIWIKSYSDNTKITVELSDSGPGIPVQFHDRLFDPFFSTKEVGKGTGLGLSLCYGIIQEHGGELRLDTNYKSGAKFVLTLPVMPLLREEKVEGTKPSLPDRARVLIIDDEREIVELEKAVIEEKFNYHIDTAGNGRDGLAFVEINNYNYDVIICDMKMPGEIDGSGLYRKIREKNERLADRIVIVTGDISGRTRQFVDENNLLCIRKPFRADEFISVVGAAIDRIPPEK